MKKNLLFSLVCVSLATQFRVSGEEPSLASQLKGALVFTTPIIWVGNVEPPKSDSDALRDAITNFGYGVKQGINALESFVARNPESPWTPSLRVHLAEHYRENGRYTLALSHWETAWLLTKDSEGRNSRDIASRAVAGWTRLLGSLGRKDQQAELFNEASRLGLDKGPHAMVLQATLEAHETMKRNPEIAYRCGSYALAQMAKGLRLSEASCKTIHETPSPEGGFTLSQLVALARKNGCEAIAVRRETGGTIVVPSVVHWKLDHYAAIVEERDGNYLVVDPTFDGRKWLEADVINGEGSGNFLIGTTNIPSGWRKLASSEAEMVHGKGYPNSIDDEEDHSGDDDPTDCPPPPTPGDGPGAGQGDECPDDIGEITDGTDSSSGLVPGDGMPIWRVSEPYISLWIHDTPLFYRSSIGRVSLRLSYKSRGTTRGPSAPGFGPKWECNWISFVERPAGDNPTHIKNYLAGGGLERFPMIGSQLFSSRSFLTWRALTFSDTNFVSAAVENRYARQNQYGQGLVFSNQVIRLFLTNRVDAYGRSDRYGYSIDYVDGLPVMRLDTMTDKDGKQCTLSYTNPLFPNQVTSVTDPYNRTACFQYDSDTNSHAFGLLTNIIDMAGMSSSFRYDASGNITNLHTPYGDTGFKYVSGANSLCALNRAIEITEPTSDKQLYAYHDLSPDDIGGFDDMAGLQHMRNSFHWNRQQYAALSDQGKTNYLEMPLEDYWKASLKHWLHGPETGTLTVNGTLSASAGPVVNTNLGSRVNQMAYGYYGQSGYYAGANKLVTDIRWSNIGACFLHISRNEWGRPTEFLYLRYVLGTGYTYVGYTNVFDADGRILQKVYGPNGELVRRYGYHATKTNLLTAVTNALGEVLRYTYDVPSVRLLTISHPSGLVTENDYYDSGDFAGFLRATVDVGFRTNSYSYVNGNRLTHTNELGLVTTNTWDGLNRLISKQFPDTTTVSNWYDTTKKLSLRGTKDRGNHWTYFNYDDLHRLTAVTNANGQVTLYDYCDCGSPSEITRLNGGSPVTTQFQYDLAGRRTRITYADGFYRDYYYDSYHQDSYPWTRFPSRIQDSSGRTLHYEFTEHGQVAKVGLSQGGTYADDYLVQRSYDWYWRVASTKERNGVTVTNGYDVLGRVTNRVTLAIDGYVSNIVSFSYTARGLTNSTDELGHNTWFVYDEAGRLLSQTNANDEVLQFTYNPADQITTLIDGKNQQTTWEYDEYGRVTRKYDAVREVFRYEYDADNRLTNRWTPEKGNTYYSYDPVGNLTNVDYPLTTMDVTLQYDLLNRLTNVTDAIGTTRFAFTDAGQLVSEDGPWVDDMVTYSYTDRRRSTLSLAQPNASPWTQIYQYDQYDRLTNITSSAGKFSYTYWTVGLLSDRVEFQGLAGDYSVDAPSHIENDYDNLARLTDTRLYGGPWGSYWNHHRYALNEANQRTRQTFMPDNPSIAYYVNYTYDDIGQLKTAKGWESDGTTPRLNEQFGYAYDKAWNLERRTNNALVQTFGVNTLNELTNATRSGTLTVVGLASQPGANISSVSVSGTGLTTGNADIYADGSWARAGAVLDNGDNTYTALATDTYGRTASDTINLSLPSTNNFAYDHNGNLTNDGRRVFEYDYENQLTNVYVATAWRSEFKYDAFGRRRVRKEYTWQSSAWVLTNEVRYVYDGMLAVQERDANNLALVSYTRGNDLSGSLQGAGGIGGLLARTDHSTLISQPSAAHAYYHADGNGNITAMVDTNGILVAKYNYDPYGNLLGMSGPLAEANTYRFSSKEYAANAALYHYGFRYYEPNLQRWLNRDPIQEWGGINLFGFVGNESINTFDPYGLAESHPILRATVPGQVAWDNAVTSWENGQYGSATLSGCTMLGEQILFVVSLGRLNSAPEAARRAAMIAEAKAAAREAILQRRDAAGTALSAARDALAKALSNGKSTAESMGQIEAQLGGRTSAAYEAAQKAWRAAQAEIAKLADAVKKAQKEFDKANQAALNCR